MKKAILVFAFIIVSAVIAEGADWVLVSRSSNGIQYYVDVSSIKKVSTGIIRSWLKIERLPDKEPLYFRGKAVKKMLLLQEHDCSEGKIQNLQLSVYYTDGNNDSSLEEGEWKYVRPDTIEDRLHKFTCDK